MKTTVTITSKRQLTIPKKVWEQLNLNGVRYLQAEVEDGNLKLKKVNFPMQLNKFWDKTNGSIRGELSDASIKEASHEARQNRSII
jgi:AbrB family looped-hinge helix DNA binding protein